MRQITSNKRKKALQEAEKKRQEFFLQQRLDKVVVDTRKIISAFQEKKERQNYIKNLLNCFEKCV
jgi:hypothetical protein